MNTPKSTRPTISEADFDRLRKDFVRQRYEQFVERRNMTWSELDGYLERINAQKEIDKVVDEQYHSSLLPERSEYLII